MKIRKNEFKIRAFADDIALTLAIYLESITKVKTILRDFDLISGLEVNADKTKMIVKNMTKKGEKN